VGGGRDPETRFRVKRTTAIPLTRDQRPLSTTAASAKDQESRYLLRRVVDEHYTNL